MKFHVRRVAPCRRALTEMFLVTLPFITVTAFAEGNLFDQIDEARHNLKSKLESVTQKSVKGVTEAQQDAPPEVRDQPWSVDNLKQLRQQHADSVNRNQEIADKQQQLINLDSQALSHLATDDPRRKEIADEMKQIASQMPDTRKSIADSQQKLAEANTAIDRWRQRTEPGYIPPSKKTTDAVTPPSEPDPPVPNEVGEPGNDLNALKQKEAQQEAATRALGKQREAAVNKYLDDPSDSNHAEAEQLKQRLDGMVDNLNAIRTQVDGLDSTAPPREPLHARSAKKIAEEHKRRKANGTNTDGAENQPTGGGCAGSVAGSGPEQHNNDGSDASGAYQDVGPGGGTGSSGAGAAAANHGNGGAHHQHAHSSMARKAQSNVTSSGGHQSGVGMNNRGATDNHHHNGKAANMADTGHHHAMSAGNTTAQQSTVKRNYPQPQHHRKGNVR